MDIKKKIILIFNDIWFFKLEIIVIILSQNQLFYYFILTVSFQKLLVILTRINNLMKSTKYLNLIKWFFVFIDQTFYWV